MGTRRAHRKCEHAPRRARPPCCQGRSGALPSRRRAATARMLCSDCGETRLETANRERVRAEPVWELDLMDVEQCFSAGVSHWASGVGRVHPLTRAGHARALRYAPRHDTYRLDSIP